MIHNIRMKVYDHPEPGDYNFYHHTKDKCPVDEDVHQVYEKDSLMPIGSVTWKMMMMIKRSPFMIIKDHT